MKKLSRSNLQSNSRPIRILQFGSGNFLRGFLDWMVQIANDKGVFNGDILIAQIHGKEKDPIMAHQDYLFHVLERGLENGKVVSKPTLVSCVAGLVNIFENYGSFLKIGENPDLRFIISNTTEAGIVFDPEDLDFQQIPETFPGKMTALLFHRFKHFNGSADKSLIFLPCELIESNGQKLQECILSYASIWDLPQEFSTWIKTHNSFCDTLVDRIVPGFPAKEIEAIQNDLGLQDQLLVTAEPFHFWAIAGSRHVEQEFPLNLAGLNVKFTSDLDSFRTRKVRILNGAHTALVPYAYLKGFRTVRAAVEDPEINNYLKTLIFEEVIPTLGMPEKELREFADSVLERFANPYVEHELKAIALNSISKFRVRVLPSLLAYVEKKGSFPENLILAFASLLVFYKGGFKGESLPVKDEEEIKAFFDEAWKKPDLADTIEMILANQKIWDQDLNLIFGLREKLILDVEKVLQF